jgi:hypothetical protein
MFQNVVPQCSNIGAEKRDRNNGNRRRISKIGTAAFGPEKAGVGGSTPSLATTSKPFANLILLAVIGSFIA